MPKGPKSEVSSTGAVLLEALRAYIEEEFGEESDETGKVIDGVSSEKLGFEQLKALSLVELRAWAKEAGFTASNKKADILNWAQQQETSSDEEESDEDVDEDEDDEEDTEEDDSDDEDETSEEETELREELEELGPVDLRKRARENDKSLKLAELKEKSNEELIELIVSQEISSEEEDEDDEESDDEDDDDSGIDPKEMMDKKIWPMPRLHKFAEENGVAIPAKVKNNRSAIVELLTEALGEDDE
jgi:AAA ATPase containing von Willebrand factor type A (vWA) domain